MNTKVNFGFAAFLAGMFAVDTAFAQTSLSIGSTPGYPGTTVSAPATLRQGGSAVAAQFDVAFNAGKVAAVDPMRGQRLTNHIFRSRQVAPGVERVLIYSLNNAAVSGTNVTVASLPFAVSPTEFVGSGPLTPTNVVLAKSDATAITPVSLNAGAIFVRAVNPLPNGSVQFFLSSIPDTRYLIQATTDFLSWVNITNLTAFGDFMNLVDADASIYPHRFYRWVLYDAAAGEIGAVTQLPGGRLNFQLNGLAGRTYFLQASADLQHWTDLSTNVATGGTINFTNMIDPGLAKRFFRLKSQ